MKKMKMSVDDVGDEIDGESDVDFDVEDREQDELDLSLNSSDDVPCTMYLGCVPQLLEVALRKFFPLLSVFCSSRPCCSLPLHDVIFPSHFGSAPRSSDDDDSEIRSNPSDESSAETEFAWSDQLQNVEVELFTARTGPNLGDLELDYTSEPYEFFKLYFPDNLIATIKEQTNLYAQQKEAPRSFKPVTDEDINLFL